MTGDRVVPDLRTQEGTVHIRVLRAPLRIWERSAQHVDELLREFSLIALSHQTEGVPARLIALIDDLTARYAGLSDEPAAERERAIAAGVREVDLDYHLPESAAEACRQLRDMLEEADAFCAAGTLMTLPAPEDQRAFNTWYLDEFIRQIAGEGPTPWPGSLD